MTTASGIIGEMADVLERDGWIQGQVSSTEGRCMWGAFHEVETRQFIEVGNARAGQLAMQAIENTVQEIAPEYNSLVNLFAISRYNDKPGRTIDEVLDTLGKARIGLEEKGL